VNGKKVKALRRAFKAAHGRAPAGPVEAEMERLRFSELPHRVQADIHAKGRAPDGDQDPFFVKTVKPAEASEMRRLKKGTLTP
jgi:hypothetical protein